MNPAQIARNTYQHFSTKEGNQHIANVYALEKIVELAHKYEVKTVLEIGLGIGSISHALLSYAKESGRSLRYIGTEANEFCLQSLPKNLEGAYQQLELYNNIEEVPADALPELIIIDGKDSSLSKVKAIAAPGAILFVEGFRLEQVKLLQSYFPKALSVVTIADFKNPPGGPFSQDSWAGGGCIIFTMPSAAQRWHYWVEKITTSLRYRIWRRLKS